MVIGKNNISPGQVAWKKFKRNPLALAGTAFIVLICAMSLAGPFIRPDDTVNANDQQLSIARKKPGFEVNVVRVKKSNFSPPSFSEVWLAGGRDHAFTEIPYERLSFEHDSVQIIPYNALDNKILHYVEEDLVMVNAEAGSMEGKYSIRKNYVLGTDKYGRDLQSRLMAGAFISIAVGFIAVIISLLLGLTIGLLAGYYRGWVDHLLMWFTNVIWSIPTLIMVMAITLIFGSGFWKIFLAVGLTMWVEVARITRGQVLGIREKEYIEAARALGFKEWRIIFKHILPNVMGPVIVISAANFASAILIEAGLSFMGLGAQIPTPSWGNMIKEHYSFITTDMAYLAIIPGLCIMLLVLAFMMVGSGLRDALDTRIR